MWQPAPEWWSSWDMLPSVHQEWVIGGKVERADSAARRRRSLSVAERFLGGEVDGMSLIKGSMWMLRAREERCHGAIRELTR